MSEDLQAVPVYVTNLEIKRKFLYDSTPVIDMKIIYPQISLSDKKAEKRINGMYTFTMERFTKYVSKHMYRDAVKHYQDAIRSEYPFYGYQANLTSRGTLLSENYFSSYFDRYEYTGGAHGQTLRFSDTWDIKTGLPVDLCSFFKSRHVCRKRILSEVLKGADLRNDDNPGLLFENYRTLIKKHFKLSRYNLIPGGISIYYQQYDIGPGVSGIITFDIPFENLT